MTQTLNDLLTNFSRITQATPVDSQEILDLSARVQMLTESGGLKFDRNPDFFALSKIQGERSYTFLFRNSDGSLKGYGCISITPMLVKGKKQYLGYTSDLRFSPDMEKETKIQFYQFYETLIREFKNIKELNSCEYIISSILDGNAAAKSVMVKKKGQNKGQLIHRPFYSYTSINVIGALPLSSTKTFVQKGSESVKDEILDFLTASEGQEITWTKDEILRRQKNHDFSWEDFLLIRNSRGEIKACCTVLSDFRYRKANVANLTPSIRLSQWVASALGRPKIKENKPLRLGYVSFLKIKEKDLSRRAEILKQFFKAIYKEESRLPKSERFHSITVHEPTSFNMGRRLLKKGFLNVELPATLYQVIHETELKDENKIKKSAKRPDFDIVFH